MTHSTYHVDERLDLIYNAQYRSSVLNNVQVTKEATPIDSTPGREMIYRFVNRGDTSLATLLTVEFVRI